MKPDIPTEVEMKLHAARQCELSIERLKAYEKVMQDTSIDFSQVTIPMAIQKRFKDWVESQTIIEKANIISYGGG